MSDNEITLVKKYLANRKENQRAQSLLIVINNTIPEKIDYVIKKNINRIILQKILSGEIK